MESKFIELDNCCISAQRVPFAPQGLENLIVIESIKSRTVRNGTLLLHLSDEQANELIKHLSEQILAKP